MMPQPPRRFTQAEITRAIKGATSAGFQVARIEIEPDGRNLVIVLGEPEKPAPKPSFFAERRLAREREAVEKRTQGKEKKHP